MAGKNPKVPVDVIARTGQFTKDIKRATAGATAAMAAMAAASVAAVALVAKATIDLSAKLNTLAKDARKVGASVEDIQRVQGAFELLTGAGVDAGRFLQDFQRNLEEIKDGSGPALDAFNKLGLSLSDIEGLPLPEQLALMGDAIGALDTQSAKTQVTLDLFGRSGRAAVEAFGEGGDAFREAVGQIEGVGLVSAEAARQAEDLQDAILLSSKAMDQLRVEVLAPLQPLLTATFQTLSSIADDALDAVAWDDYGAAIKRAVINTGIPALATFKNLTADIVDFMGPLSKTMQMFAYDAGIVGAVLAGDFEMAGKNLKRSKELAEEAGWGFTLLQGKLEDNRAEAFALVDALTAMVSKAGEAGSALGRVRKNKPTGEPADRKEALDATASAEDAFFADRIGASEEYAEALAEIEAEMAAATEEAEKKRQDAIAKTARKREETLEWTLWAVQQGADVALRILDAAAEGEKAIIDGTTEDRKEAALKAFEVNKNTQLAQAHILREIGALMAFATAPNYIAGVAMAIAAQAQGWVNFGMIAATQPPEFHMGGPVGRPSTGPDEVNATLLRGERVQSRAEVRQGRSAAPSITVLQVGSRTVDAFIGEALRTGQGTTYDNIRGMQAQRVGRHNPHLRR